MKEFGPFNAGVEQLVNAYTGGFRPKVSAAGIAAIEKLKGMPYGPAYEKALQEILQREAGNAQENPNAARAAQLGGALLSPMLGGATAGQRIGGAILTGAIGGAGTTYNGNLEDYGENIAAGGTIGGAGGAIGEQANKAIRGTFGVTAEKLKPFYEANIEPTLGAVGNKLSKFVQNVSANTLGGMGKFEQIADKTYNKIENYVNKLSSKSNLTQEMKGNIARKGLEETRSLGNEAVNKSYEDLKKILPNNTEIPVDNLVSHVTKLKKELSPAAFDALKKTPAGSRIEDILKEAEPKFDYVKGSGVTKALPYDRALQLKREIGELAYSKEAKSAGIGTKQGALRQLYRYLDDSINIGADKLGGKAGEQLRATNKLASQNIVSNKKIERVLAKEDAEKIFKSISNSGKFDYRIAEKAMKGLDKEGKKELSHGIISEMGDDAENIFNTTLLAKRFNGLEPEAQKLLLNSFDTSTQKNFKNIMETIGSNKEIAKEANNSKTAYYAGLLTALGSIGLGINQGGLEGGLAATALIGKGAAINNAAARLMTSPKFINWLAGAEGKVGSNSGAHFAKLYNIAKEDPSIAPDIKKYADSLNGGTNVNDSEFDNLSKNQQERIFYEDIKNMSDTEFNTLLQQMTPEEQNDLEKILFKFEPE